MKESRKKYNQRPDIKKKHKEYHQREDIKNKQKEYYKKPEVKQYMLEYRQKPGYKEAQRRRNIKYVKTHPDYVKRRAEVQKSPRVRWQKMQWAIKNQKYDPLNNKEAKIKLDAKYRDEFKCRWLDCEQTSDLQAHHIWPKAKFPEFRLLSVNMITYCREHHAKWHEQLGEINVANMILNRGCK